MARREAKSDGWFASLPWESQLLSLLLGITLLRGAVYAIIVPILQLADEPDYFVDMQGFANGLLPGWAPPPIGSVSGSRGFFQLIYLPVYLATSRLSTYMQVISLRLVSVAMTVATVYVIYRVAKAIAPDNRFITLGAPALALFIPQFTHVGASFTPDVPATLAASIFFLFVVQLIKNGFTIGRLVGLVLSMGAAVLSKQTAFFVVLIALLLPAAMLLARRPANSDERSKRNRNLAIWAGSLFVLSPVISFLSSKVTETTIGLDLARQVLSAPFLVETFGQLSDPANPFFKSFWAHAGFLKVAFEGAYYAVLVTLGTAAVAGLVVYFLHAAFARGDVERWQVVVIALFAVAVVLSVAVVLIRSKLVPPNFGGQGRWAFPVIAAFAVLAVMGWRQAFGERGEAGALVALVLNLFVLDGLFLTRYVIPQYYISFPGVLNNTGLSFGSKVAAGAGAQIANMRLIVFTWRGFYSVLAVLYLAAVGYWCWLALMETGSAVEPSLQDDAPPVALDPAAGR